LPCDPCLQVIAEMADTEFQIVLYDADGNSKTCTIDEFLSHALTANLVGSCIRQYSYLLIKINNEPGTAELKLLV